MQNEYVMFVSKDFANAPLSFFIVFLYCYSVGLVLFVCLFAGEVVGVVCV